MTSWMIACLSLFVRDDLATNDTRFVSEFELRFSFVPSGCGCLIVCLKEHDSNYMEI